MQSKKENGPIGREVFCVQCDTKVEARMIDGRRAYPHRDDLADKKFWECPTCKRFVGAHPGSGHPLGCIPSSALAKARMVIHAMLDPIWKSGRMTRGEVYNRMSKALGGKRYHTGNLSNMHEAEAARKVVEVLMEEVFPRRVFEITGKIVLGFIHGREQQDYLLDDGRIELRRGVVTYITPKGERHASITTPAIISVSLEHGRIRELEKDACQSEGNG